MATISSDPWFSYQSLPVQYGILWFLKKYNPQIRSRTATKPWKFIPNSKNIKIDLDKVYTAYFLDQINSGEFLQVFVSQGSTIEEFSNAIKIVMDIHPEFFRN